MLKQRVITASLLASGFLASMFYLPPLAFASLIGVFVLLAGWEWSRIAGWQTLFSQLSYVALLAVTMVVLYTLHWHFPQLERLFFGLATLWWGVAFWWVWCAQQGHPLSYLSNTYVKSFLGVLILIPAWLALSLLHKYYAHVWLLFLLFLIWGADIGAFFSGRRWGKRKLASRISPGKSWEGVWGAMIAAIILTLLYTWWQKFDSYASITLILLSLLTVAVSILGDLLESLFKRQMHMKDSSQLLPGHGGVLDRIDSLSAAAPIFLLGLLYWKPGEYL